MLLGFYATLMEFHFDRLVRNMLALLQFLSHRGADTGPSVTDAHSKPWCEDTHGCTFLRPSLPASIEKDTNKKQNLRNTSREEEESSRDPVVCFICTKAAEQNSQWFVLSNRTDWEPEL